MSKLLREDLMELDLMGHLPILIATISKLTNFILHLLMTTQNIVKCLVADIPINACNDIHVICYIC